MSEEKRRFIRRWIVQERLLLSFIVFVGVFLLVFSYAFELWTVMSYLVLLYGLFAVVFVMWQLLAEWFRIKNLKHSTRDWRTLLTEGQVTEGEAWLMAELADLTQLVANHDLVDRQAQKEQLDYYTMWVHQIKTSIAASQLLIQALPNVPEKSPLEQELIKITTYTDFVLHYVRMETFHQDLVLTEVSIDTIMKQILKKYATFFIYKKLQFEYDPIDKTIITDSKWFSVIVEQILSNAIKYTESGGKIRITLEGDMLCIQDTGIGISPADQERIFDRGFSGFNGRMEYHSTGLGLYLSNEIAKKLGIHLSVVSTVGEGTTMKIHLNQETLVAKE